MSVLFISTARGEHTIHVIYQNLRHRTTNFDVKPSKIDRSLFLLFQLVKSKTHQTYDLQNKQFIPTPNCTSSIPIVSASFCKAVNLARMVDNGAPICISANTIKILDRMFSTASPSSTETLRRAFAYRIAFVD